MSHKNAEEISDLRTTLMNVRFTVPIYELILQAMLNGKLSKIILKLEGMESKIEKSINLLDDFDMTLIHRAVCSEQHISLRVMVENLGGDINKKNSQGLTALHFATQLECDPAHFEQFHRRTVEYLLAKSSNINATDNCGWTALHHSVFHDNQAVANLLLQAGANVNLADLEGKTPLIHAVMRSSEKMTRFLFDKGADFKSVDCQGNNLLHHAAGLNSAHFIYLVFQLIVGGKGSTSSSTSSRGDDGEGLEMLNTANVKGNPPMFIAIKGGFDKVRLFEQLKADLTVVNGKQKSAIHIAASHGNLKVFEHLLNKDLPYAKLDSRGRSPLHCAIKYGNLQILDLCLKSKRNYKVDKADCDGETPLLKACHLGRSEMVNYLLKLATDPTKFNNYGQNSLILAIKAESIECVKLLLDCNACENLIKYRDSNLETALHAAVRVGNEKILELLLSHNPDRLARNIRQQTPLHVAARMGHPIMVDLLLGDYCGGDNDQGGGNSVASRITSQLNLTDANGSLPLHLAAAANDISTLRLLLYLQPAGTSINDLVDSYGRTPLHYACSTVGQDDRRQESSMQAIKFLIYECHASVDQKDKALKSPIDIARDQHWSELVSLLAAHSSTSRSPVLGEPCRKSDTHCLSPEEMRTYRSPSLVSETENYINRQEQYASISNLQTLKGSVSPASNNTTLSSYMDHRKSKKDKQRSRTTGNSSTKETNGDVIKKAKLKKKIRAALEQVRDVLVMLDSLCDDDAA